MLNNSIDSSVILYYNADSNIIMRKGNIMENINVNPLENLVTDGGFVGIFRTIGCIGDSLASGEFQSTKEDGKQGFHDMYEYSRGQYMAREAGCTVYNFSRGGMSAKWFNDSFEKDCGIWSNEK